METNILRRKTYSLAILVALITILVYLPALENEFVEWDDDLYIYNNLHIRSLNLNFLTWAFFSFHAANWHPLTWISHAIDYAIWGLNPLGHHLTSVILHGLNTFLVVVLVARLTPPNLPLDKGRLGGVITALVTGLLFGLHPLHVESVAWVSERKDVLCAFFFLLSIITYTKYVTKIFVSFPLAPAPSGAGLVGNRSCLSGIVKKDCGQAAMTKTGPLFLNKQYLLSLGFFLLALLSKPMAVTLPLVLLIMDWYPFRRFEGIGRLRPIVIEKLPFFTLSLASAVLTLLAQHSGRMIRPLDIYPLSERILVGFKALTSYLGKMVWPIKLSPYYPYQRDMSFLSYEYLLPALLVIGITIACIVLLRRQRFWSALWGYYVITLLPVLGIIQVGGQAMANRYIYLPSIGPFLFIGLGVTFIFEKLIASGRWNMITKTVSLSTAIVLIISMSYMTIKQIRIWKDSVVLWSRVIEIEPMKDDMPYHNRGMAYINLGLFENAQEDLTKAIYLDRYAVVSYYMRGISFMKLGRLEEALKDFSKVIDVGPVPDNNYCINAYFNRATIYTRLNRFEDALRDYTKAIDLSPTPDSDYYYNRGIVYMKLGHQEEAIKDFMEAERIRK